jgi:hypothetical protein
MEMGCRGFARAASSKSRLEDTEEPQAEREWRVEIERRSVELKSDKATGVPAVRVFKKARAALR